MATARDGSDEIGGSICEVESEASTSAHWARDVQTMARPAMAARSPGWINASQVAAEPQGSGTQMGMLYKPRAQRTPKEADRAAGDFHRTSQRPTPPSRPTTRVDGFTKSKIFRIKKEE